MKSISIYRLNAFLLFIILTTILLYFGKPFLIPLCFSILFAMLLYPVCQKLERWGLSRVASTLAGMFIILLFIAFVVGIVVSQGASMSEDLPQMQARAQEIINNCQQWIQDRYGITQQEQLTYLEKGIGTLSESGGKFFSDTISWIITLLTDLVLVLLYFFFFMWKREKYKEFLLKLVKEENRTQTSGELKQIGHVAAQYLFGRLISMLFLAVVYMIGFSIVGLPNGLLMALVAVLPTIVPYIGAFVGGFFPLAMALIGTSPETALPIAIILIVAQIIDNNIIEPLVEGESLDISPIFTIIAIVLGGMIWGVAGMILFMPLFAILKIICDHIPSLHPFSYLLTNEVEEPKWVNSLKKWFNGSR